MPMFDGDNCWKKFVQFSVLLTVSFAIILSLSAFIGLIASILVLGLLSIALRIIVDNYGDRMLTDPDVYMSPSQMEEFGKKELDSSKFSSPLG